VPRRSQFHQNLFKRQQLLFYKANLVALRGGESSGLALPVYIMSTIMVFVMWALVAAIPCQERNSLLTHFPVPRQLGWAQSMIVLQDKIAEEWKKKKEEQVCWEGIFVTWAYQNDVVWMFPSTLTAKTNGGG
jgi:hypothetical protein